MPRAVFPARVLISHHTHVAAGGFLSRVCRCHIARMWGQWRLGASPTCVSTSRRTRVAPVAAGGFPSRVCRCHIARMWGQWRLGVSPTCVSTSRRTRVAPVAAGGFLSRVCRCHIARMWCQWRLGASPTCVSTSRRTHVAPVTPGGFPHVRVDLTSHAHGTSDHWGLTCTRVDSTSHACWPIVFEQLSCMRVDLTSHARGLCGHITHRQRAQTLFIDNWAHPDLFSHDVQFVLPTLSRQRTTHAPLGHFGSL
jgi:hypothetical protein